MFSLLLTANDCILQTNSFGLVNHHIFRPTDKNGTAWFKLESKMPYLHIWINNFRSPDDIIRMHMQLADICPGTRDPNITNNIKCGANIWNVETSLGWGGLGWRGSGIWFMLTSNKIQSGHFSKSTCLIVCSSIQISLCSAARPHRQIGTRLRDGFKTYLIYFSCSLNSFRV